LARLSRFFHIDKWWQICHHGPVSRATGAKDDLLDALTVIADGGKPVIAKPLTGLGSGVMELALRHRGDAYRVVYALQVAREIWVIHAFQKKSKTGIKTPKAEIDLVIERLRTAGKINASNVIASGALCAAKQSRVRGVDSGLLRRQGAPRNDGLKHLFLPLS
jgi:phage-related protein